MSSVKTAVRAERAGPSRAAPRQVVPPSLSRRAAGVALLSGLLSLPALAPAVAEDKAPTMSISFTPVSQSVRDAMRQRDANMAWKCKGVSMYDCDGSLAEEAEKRAEEMRAMFKSNSSGGEREDSQ